MIYFVAIIEDNQNVFVEPYLLFQSLYYLELDSVARQILPQRLRCRGHFKEKKGKKRRKKNTTKIKNHKPLGSLWWAYGAELRCSASNCTLSID